jgi:predicted phosphodiesterase
MKLGLITDIHEQVEFLRIALDRFRQEQVDRVVVIGDIFETGERIEETCQMLAEAKAVGVWGNHDYGLCVDTPDDIRARFPATVNYMTSLRPRLELDGCYFVCAHQNRWGLWWFGGRLGDAACGRLGSSGCLGV